MTNGCEKLVFAPLISGTPLPNGSAPRAPSTRSTIHTVFAETPHGCSVTFSPAVGVAATPTHSPVGAPKGAYSSSYAFRSKPLPRGSKPQSGKLTPALQP